MKKTIIKICISILLLIIIELFKIDENVKTLIYLIPYLTVGFGVLKKSIKKIKRKDFFDENFLMSIATIGAFIIKERREAVFVMIFYQIGELFQKIAVENSKKDIKTLAKIIPNSANLLKDNKPIIVNADKLKIGDEVLVKPFERIPIDGIVIDGESEINLSILTGESMPVGVKVNDSVASGTINQTGILKIRATKSFDESSANKILELVETAGYKKAKVENIVTSFSRVWTPIVCMAASLVFIIPNIIILFLTKNFEINNIYVWGYRALCILVISCPCALLVSVPLAMFLGIAKSSKDSILIKGTNIIETLAKVNKIFLDKTGTLTKGVFDVVDIKSFNFDRDELLKFAAYAEYYSSHPIAKSIIKKYGKEIDVSKIENYKELENSGIIAKILDREVLVGNRTIMIKNGINIENETKVGIIIYVVIDKILCGIITISDEIKEKSKETIKSLKKIGVAQIKMLTGDRREEAERVAKELQIESFEYSLSPKEKIEILDREFEKNDVSGKICFVGDGINDAACIKRADVGIAMGIKASDMISDIADVIILDDNPIKIRDAIKISKRTINIVKQNIVFSITIKLMVFLSTIIFSTNMWLAIFSDVGVLIIVILNSLRVMIMNY